VFSENASEAATPASVQKLIVSYTALNLLGPSYRFDTIFAARQGIGADGTLAGPLWLVGSGDPSFRSTDLASGVQALVRGGLHSISGGLAVDATAIAGPEINPYWSSSDANEDYQAPTSGVSIDGDTAEFRVYGRAAGEPARIAVVPQSADLKLYGGVETGGGDDVTIASYVPNEFHLSGNIPPAIEEKFWLPVHGIPRYAGDVLALMLRNAGVTIDGGVSIEPAPLDTITLWMHRSAPLTVLLRHMLYVSDNHYAEQLLRTLAREAGSPDDAHGIEVETEFLRSRNIPTQGLHLVDGSGLAEANRVSALTLARILSDAELRNHGAELYPLLADTHEGTVKYYDFTTAAGRVHAKTGHLNDADSLAGYVDTKYHGRLAFAFMINNSPGDPDTAYVRAVDALAGM
jgi:D-alanyl-D-alanine carboxypeptidase/D-alanyl-D-alanine-endopeptidase (penicillin-binding protein 4)